MQAILRLTGWLVLGLSSTGDNIRHETHTRTRGQLPTETHSPVKDSFIRSKRLSFFNLTLTDVTPNHVVKILHQGAGADSGAAADIHSQAEWRHQLVGKIGGLRSVCVGPYSLDLLLLTDILRRKQRFFGCRSPSKKQDSHNHRRVTYLLLDVLHDVLEHGLQVLWSVHAVQRRMRLGGEEVRVCHPLTRQ